MCRSTWGMGYRSSFLALFYDCIFRMVRAGRAGFFCLVSPVPWSLRCCDTLQFMFRSLQSWSMVIEVGLVLVITTGCEGDRSWNISMVK